MGFAASCRSDQILITLEKADGRERPHVAGADGRSWRPENGTLTSGLPDAPNLVRADGVTITVVPVHPTGGAARDPAILLDDEHEDLDGCPISEFSVGRTYDTYDGPNHATGPDWYVIDLPVPVPVNTIEMTMGLPYRDGGWWTSLSVEARVEPDGDWREVRELRVLPPLDFTDARCERRPFMTHALIFEETVVSGVRIIGAPGGPAEFTSLARLALYHRDLSRWNPASLPVTPVPALYRVISPLTIWNLSADLVRLTGLPIGAPMMEFYLDDERFRSFWDRTVRGATDSPELWVLLGEALGWASGIRRDASAVSDRSLPHVGLDTLGIFAVAVAPVIVNGELLAELSTRWVLLEDTFDPAWHRRFASEHGIDWARYEIALAQTPRMTRDQLGGAAGLIGSIANATANLAHRLDLMDANQIRATNRAQLARRAIDYMEEHLEDPIGVAEVARALDLTPAYFATVFAAQMGRPPGEVLIELRLERAKQYLAHTSMSVMAVCVALGYSPSYFSRLFKSRTGLAPGQYASQHRQHCGPHFRKAKQKACDPPENGMPSPGVSPRVTNTHRVQAAAVECRRDQRGSCV